MHRKSNNMFAYLKYTLEKEAKKTHHVKQHIISVYGKNSKIHLKKKKNSFFRNLISRKKDWN